MKKIIRIGRGEAGDVFCKIEFVNKEGKGGVLSITGVEGPKSNGDCRGSCGQIYDHIRIKDFAPGWDHKTLAEFIDVWRRWHLNDLRAACEHQRASAAFNPAARVIIYKYGWSNQYYNMRTRAQGGKLTAEEYAVFAEVTPAVDGALFGLEHPKYPTEEIKRLLSEGWIEEKKQEEKSAGWVSYKEHPQGLLGAPCPTCGYKYGTSWLFEPVPSEVIEFLSALPDTDKTPAWV